MDAKQLVKEVIEGRARWGKAFGAGPFRIDDVMDALVELHNEGLIATDASKEDLVKAKRQLTASQAREAKLKKQVKSLKNQVDQMATSRKEAGVDE